MGVPGPWYEQLPHFRMGFTPSRAGIVNLAGSFNPTTNAELTEVYNNLGNASDFTDITSGTCGHYHAMKGWDFCTGVGVDNGLMGK